MAEEIVKRVRLDPKQTFSEVIDATEIAVREINKFTEKVFKTRGKGRMGSGMGTLLEALWAYFVDQGRPAREVGNEGWEIGWLPDHEYNDYACVECDVPWDPATKAGEFFRIEAKSMNKDAEESKGHFSELFKNLGESELLLVLIWSWKQLDRDRVSPTITDYFIGLARPVAVLRDKLHIARGGSFVDKNNCPDGCSPADCTHHGEPLNASGKRERLSGPKTRKPAGVSFAANFGGLMRMLKTSSPAAKKVFSEARAADDTAHRFISFMHRNFPNEEWNAISADVWKRVAAELNINTAGLELYQVVIQVRANPAYMDVLRRLGK